MILKFEKQHEQLEVEPRCKAIRNSQFWMESVPPLHYVCIMAMILTPTNLP